MPPAPLTGIRAVLFDLDGTLVHTPIDFARMKREVLAEAEAAGVDPEPLRRHDILRIVELAEEAHPGAGLRERCEERLAAIEAAAASDARLAEGALDVLDWLRGAGAGVGIVTRNNRATVAGILARHPLPHDVLLTRADTPRVKPDPQHLLLALERLGVAPARAVMVGDHRMDVQAGRAAGMAAIGILLPGRPAGFFADLEPHAVIRGLPELRRWISPSSS